MSLWGVFQPNHHGSDVAQTALSAVSPTASRQGAASAKRVADCITLFVTNHATACRTACTTGTRRATRFTKRTAKQRADARRF
jgi:hypothetical protein